MDAPSSDDVADALRRAVHRLLLDNQDVPLPGLGTLTVHHERSTVEERPNGEMLLHPPRDVVTFTPEDTAEASGPQND